MTEIPDELCRVYPKPQQEQPKEQQREQQQQQPGEALVLCGDYP